MNYETAYLEGGQEEVKVVEPCKRCGRRHSGICGIPAGVTLGFGARVGGIGSSSRSDQPVRGKPKHKGKSVNVLKEMLGQARAQEKKLSDMLNVIPIELPEYDDLLDRLGKLEALILQLTRQIIERERR